ncbi:4'-phosphopantetheinyl transferase superfamily protein [Kitasatospora sp. NPDC087861]|uniref:4'-phosphopantetheinyl transferase superfamily protein n=1 Tax=Kitasatospora sp. NPDC087861 TaxID=3364070 RepID=UPI00381CC55E
MSGLRLLWAPVRPGAAAEAVRAGRLGAGESGLGGFVGQARQDQWYAARHTLRRGLLRLGLVPDLPGAYRRIGLADPDAVRLVSWDGVALRPVVQFSVAHTAEQVVVAVRWADPAPAGRVGGAGRGAERGAPDGLGVDVETEWSTAERGLHRFGTDAELAALGRACGSVRPLHLWCVKEALAKASGLGFRVPPLRYRLRPGTGAPHRLAVRIDDGEPRPARVRTGTRIAADRPPAAWAVVDLPAR